MKMYQDLKKMFWWPRMRRDIADFVSRTSENLHDFCSPCILLSESETSSLWISSLVCLELKKTWIPSRLTKSTHFILVNVKYSLEKLSSFYIQEIVRLHGKPSNIALDRDPKFTSRFQGSLHQALGTKCRLS
ncbi:hypothetical protein CR513_36351, partial [Mucuna pruriens]